MGLGLVGAGAVAPAAAAPGPATEACDNFSAQQAATGELSENWYQSCVPQYGAGKAEFSIVADGNDASAEFPEGFVPLDELEAVDISSTSNIAAMHEYFDALPSGIEDGSPIVALDRVDGDATTQRYTASVIAPITSVGVLNLEGAIPAGAAQCLATELAFTGAWVAHFDAIDTTYSQTIDGQAWNYRITATPLPTYFFANFVDGEVGEWCITTGLRTESVYGGSVRSGSQLFEMVTPAPIPDDLSFLNLGEFGPYVPPAAVIPAATLPDTGANALPLAVAAGSFTAVGFALLGFVRLAGRRRSRA